MYFVILRKSLYTHFLNVSDMKLYLQIYIIFCNNKIKIFKTLTKFTLQQQHIETLEKKFDVLIYLCFPFLGYLCIVEILLTGLKNTFNTTHI